MRRFIPRLVGAACLLLLAACGSPTTPEGYPDVQGDYVAFLSTEWTSVPGGVVTTGGPCPVTLFVTSQSRGSFAGTAERGSPCVRATQQVGGAVERDGRLQVGFEARGAFQGFDECRHVAGDQWWRGDFRDGEMTLAIDTLLDCAGSGQLQARGTITARRVPDSR